MPVTKSEARRGEEHRDAGHVVRLAPAPGRRAREHALVQARRPARARLRVSSVSIQPGSTALTWMLSARPGGGERAWSAARCRPCWRHRRARSEAPKIDIIEPMLMILPPPAFFIADRRPAQQTKALVRLVSSTARHSSSVYSCGGLRMLMPALLTRMSSRPKRVDRVAHHRAACASSATSAARRGASRAEPRSSAAAARSSRVAAGDDDRRAGRGEAARHAEPDAAVAAGHERHPAGEVEQGSGGRSSHAFSPRQAPSIAASAGSETGAAAARIAAGGEGRGAGRPC